MALVNFEGADGQLPFDGLSADTAGNLFGVTVAAGAICLCHKFLSAPPWRCVYNRDHRQSFYDRKTMAEQEQDQRARFIEAARKAGASEDKNGV
jgi:hypothetical protein